jgi:hypothetical protein
MRLYFAAISWHSWAIVEARGMMGAEMPASAMMKNGDLPSWGSSQGCLISEIAVARSISRVVLLPSGEGFGGIIAHCGVVQ